MAVEGLQSERPRVVIIAAMSRNRVIGRSNTLPWRCSADLKRFKRLTTGSAIVMGRKTWDSIGRPLPRRLNIVISRQVGLRIEGAEVVHDLTSALRLAAERGTERKDDPRGEESPEARRAEWGMVGVGGVRDGG